MHGVPTACLDPATHVAASSKFFLAHSRAMSLPSIVAGSMLLAAYVARVPSLPHTAAPSWRVRAVGGTTMHGAATDEVAGGVAAAWPLLHEIASFGVWRGTMHYAQGADELRAAPFVLSGSTQIAIDPSSLASITSSVVLPNGAERTVSMRGVLGDAGSTARLETADGPISLLLSEVSVADTLLVREVNKTDGRDVMSSSLVLIRGDDGSPVELLQTAHELTRPGGGVSGVQMWRMRPVRGQGELRGQGAVRREALLADADLENDEEAFMYSGSEL